MSGMYWLARFAWSSAMICQWRSSSSTEPLGRLALAAACAARTSSSPIAYLLSAVGFSSTRTAGSDAPPTVTWPTPSAWEIFCARMVEAASYISPRSSVSEVSARIMIGATAGFTLRYVGLRGRLVGSWLLAALIAACTSRAAPSISRSRSNCSVMRELPSEDDEVISVTPAMRPSARSRGVATVAAMTSGLAPGSCACTEIVGKSTCGSGATGRRPKAAAPASVTPAVSSTVATGRRMEDSGRFIFIPSSSRRGAPKGRGGGVNASNHPGCFAATPPYPRRGKHAASRYVPTSRLVPEKRCVAARGISSAHAPRQAIEPQVDHRGGKERERLGEDEAAHHGDAERVAQLRAHARAEREGQRAEQRRQRRHQDRAEPQEAGVIDRLARAHAVLPLGIEREVDHHDGVLLDDADQEDDADHRDDAEVALREHKRKQGPHARGGQRGEDRERVDVALVEHSQHDVHGHDRGEDEQQLVGERRPERERCALEARAHRKRQLERPCLRLDRADGRAERGPGGEIEGDGRRRKLAEVIHREKRRLLGDRGDRAQGHLGARGRGDGDVLQRVRAAAEFRLHFEHHAVLVRLREDGRDQPLPEC